MANFQIISVDLDVTKIPKERIVAKSYQTKNGMHNAKNIALEVVENRQPQVLKSYEGGDLVKTHSFKIRLTKEERAAGVRDIYVGDGLQFIKRDQQQQQPAPQQQVQRPVNPDWDAAPQQAQGAYQPPQAPQGQPAPAPGAYNDFDDDIPF